ncbi:MAG TPA: hypothetical protein VF625_14140 [Longimicrobium sp.]
MNPTRLRRASGAALLAVAGLAGSADGQGARDSAVAAFRAHVNANAGFAINAGSLKSRDSFQITGARGCVLEVVSRSSSEVMEQENRVTLDLATVAPPPTATGSRQYEFATLRLNTASGGSDWKLRRVTRMARSAEDRREVPASFLEIGFNGLGAAERARTLLDRAVAACSPRPVAARTAVAGPSAAPRITSFNRFAWGSRRPAIQARDGAPRSSETEPAGVVVLGYTDTVFGERADIFYSVHPRHGLYSGGYVVALRTGADCEAVLRRFEQAIAERYPEITPDRSRGNDATSLGFCDAVRIGRARSVTTWRDPVSGATARVALAAGSRDIVIKYSSPEAPAIIGEQQAAERDQRF